MSLANLLGSNRVEDLVGEFEQPDKVRDGRAVEAEPTREFFLGTTVAREIFAESDRLIDRVEVFALKVLNHRQLEHALVVEFEDPGGDLVEVGFDTGPESSLAGDEFVTVADGADEDRLEHAMLPKRVGQRGDLLRIEEAPGLIRIGVDLVDGEVEELGRGERTGLESSFFAAEECFETASEASLVIHDP
jgi:hypothetical protein